MYTCSECSEKLSQHPKSGNYPNVLARGFLKLGKVECQFCCETTLCMVKIISPPFLDKVLLDRGNGSYKVGSLAVGEVTDNSMCLL